ncbi:MAG: hypothetical protein HZB76_01065 [Chlamydiae bacterium]|nr:hypothetical protein [Chlamydiota bacterium]
MIMVERGLRTAISTGYNDNEVDCIAAARAVLGSKEAADVDALQKFSESAYSTLKIYLSYNNLYHVEAF